MEGKPHHIRSNELTKLQKGYMNPAKPLESFLDQCEVFFAESALFLAVLFGLAKVLRAEDLLNLTSFQYWKGHQSILRN